MDHIESLRAGWLPPFCPNPDCPFHDPSTPGWRFKKIGFFRRDCAPNRIQRFLCRHCRRSFSAQTFATTYWKKRPDLVVKVFELAASGACHRQMTRALKCSPATVDHHMQHLARHCLLFHELNQQDAPPPTDVVIDGLVSFERSQYYPFEHHLVVEVSCAYVLGFSDSPLRRSGAMTSYQKRRRAELEARFGRPDPRAVRKDMHELLRRVLRGCQRVIVRSDAHQSYPLALQGLDCEVEHRVTSSRKHRDTRNSLWEINLFDRNLRHDEPNHRRETAAWAKRRQGSADRMAVSVVLHNWVEPRRAKRCRSSPAMLKGLCDRLLTVKDILSRRLFPSQVQLEGRPREYYWREVVTPSLGVNRRHEKKYAV